MHAIVRCRKLFKMPHAGLHSVNIHVLNINNHGLQIVSNGNREKRKQHSQTVINRNKYENDQKENELIKSRN